MTVEKKTTENNEQVQGEEKYLFMKRSLGREKVLGSWLGIVFGGAGKNEYEVKNRKKEKGRGAADPKVIRSCFSLSGFSLFVRALLLLQRGMLSTREHIGNNIVQRPRYNEIMI